MDNKDREKIRGILKQHIEQTEESIGELKEVTRPVAPDESIGRLSRMDAINNKSVNEEALRKAENRLKKLKRALEDIDKPEFGYCIRCGEAIPVGRLDIMPESKRCVKCS